MSLTKTHNVCLGTFSFQGTGANIATGTISFAGEPSWVNDGVDGSEITYQFQPNATGTFVFDVTTTGPNADTGEITINVSDCFANREAECCECELDIAWLAPSGAWRNFVFTGKHTSGVDVGRTSEYKDADNNLRYSEIRDVRATEVVTTGFVYKNDIDFIESLFTRGIQAYLWNADTDNWDIPIVVDQKSIKKYRCGDTKWEAQFSFSYAEEAVIQTQ